MITVNQADQIIHEAHFSPRVATVSIGEATGKVLAEQIRADRDLPPFNRATMDGIALASSSFKKGTREFIIKATQPAGVAPLDIDSPAQCIEIMTGAVVADSVDAVVRYEDLTIKNGKAVVNLSEITPGQNIHQRGKDAAQGSVLLEAAQKISPAEIALMASVGFDEVRVFQPPRVAVVSTGDELVAVEESPEPWQIRTSNSHSLVAAMGEMGIAASMQHLADDEASIEKGLKRILDNHDVVILSGGVSKGKFDYIPSALTKYGVEKKFHEVSQRPGKPLWFGRGSHTTVFALPGNPVSTFMCFHRYVKPWLERSLGLTRHPQFAILGKDFEFKVPLTYFLQVGVRNESGRLIATPDAGGGSGDFANLKNVDGFLELPLERSEFKSGEAFPYYPFRS